MEKSMEEAKEQDRKTREVKKLFEFFDNKNIFIRPGLATNAFPSWIIRIAAISMTKL
jgi:hypothetical protein